MALRLTLILLLITTAFWGSASAQKTSDRIAALTDDHGYFPCMDCHADQETISRPRILEEEHAEPLEWEDEDGNIHLVSFGQKVAISDLLGGTGKEDLEADNLTRIGERVQIREYMEVTGMAPEDSVWTLVHGGGNLWCLDCHDTEDRDKLVKLNGDKLTYNQSQLLCGECHGPILRDWEMGIHGKTVGYWDQQQDGDETSIRLLCVECHLPHRPAFPRYDPMPGPVVRVDGPGVKAHEATAHDADPEGGQH